MRSRYALIYLQEAIYYLPPYICLVGSEEFALEHAKDAFCDAEVGLEVFGYWWWSTLVTAEVGDVYIYNS